MWESPGLPGMWGYAKDYPSRLKEQFLQGMGQFSRTRSPSSLIVNPLSPLIQDAAVQAGGLIAPQVNALSQSVSQGSENLGLGPLSIPEVTDEQLAPFLMLGMGGRNKMGFYSPSGKALTTAPGKGQSGQYLAHLKKEPGATREAKETGLLQALEQAPGTLTKEEVVSMWNPIELDETVKGASVWSDPYTDANMQAIEDRLDYIDNLPRVAMTPELQTERRELVQFISEGIEPPENLSVTKYSNDESLNLPGGTNPKEILVQLPYPRLADFDSREAYNEAVRAQDQKGGLYERGHWDEPNVLAHIRTNERDVGGKKALHIEEIQSDWHQAGQKKGYKVSKLGVEKELADLKSRQDAFDNRWSELDAELQSVRGESDWWKVEGRFEQEYGRSPRLESEIRSEMDVLTKKMDEGIEEEVELEQADKVPDAPYKKDWHELAFKRALMEGINDPSIERLTWTTGDVQADRYNLAKYINSIEAQAVGDNFNLAVIHKDGHAQNLQNVTPDELSDYVGKEMAEKIVREKGGMYSGLDLEVGGEYHKQLYDGKITKFAQKFLKKYGVEPEKWQAPSASENPTATAKDGTFYYIGGRADGDDIWHILKEMPDDSEGKWVDDVLMETPGNMDAAREALRKYGDLDDSPYDLWYIDITPEMRQDLQEKGVPLAMNTGLMPKYA